VKIAVAGGTGRVGRHVVEVLRERGHEPLVLARSTGFDVLVGAGLAEALAGVDAVIDVLSVFTQKDAESRVFFDTTTRNLLDAERASGVGHHVLLGIIGSNVAPYGHYAGKVSQERLVHQGRVPWTEVRAAQFHEFAEQLYGTVTLGPFILAPRMRSPGMRAYAGRRGSRVRSSRCPRRGREAEPCATGPCCLVPRPSWESRPSRSGSRPSASNVAAMRAIQLTEFGGPEKLVPEELPDPIAADGEEVLEVLAAGINYADTHQTEDSYLAKQTLPLIPGSEVVVRGSDGSRLLGFVSGGGYAERIAVNPKHLFPIPDGVSDADALTSLVQGATAWHLLRTSAHLAAGETVVVHAGAGGVGTIAIQLARKWGAGRIIATASTPEKRALALELGADVAIDSQVDDLTAALKDANGGRGVDVVLEMTGGPVFDASLRALAPLGRLAVFGMAGRVPPHDIPVGMLMARSTAVIGFWLVHIVQRPALLAEAVTGLLGMLDRGELRAVIGEQYRLDTVSDAHRSLLDRSSVGKLILVP
jgi:NADPH2:quinone reductase